MVVKYAITPERTSESNMPVGQDVSSLRINNEPCSLTAHAKICIEAAGLAEVD